MFFGTDYADGHGLILVWSVWSIRFIGFVGFVGLFRGKTAWSGVNLRLLGVFYPSV